MRRECQPKNARSAARAERRSLQYYLECDFDESLIICHIPCKTANENTDTKIPINTYKMLIAIVSIGLILGYLRPYGHLFMPITTASMLNLINEKAMTHSDVVADPAWIAPFRHSSCS